MSENIDHEAAKRIAKYCISRTTAFSSSINHLCVAYLDMVAQRDAERERVAALEKLHKETSFSLRQWNNQLAEEYAHKRTAIMEGRDNG